MLLMAHACRLSFFVSDKNCFFKIIQPETNVNGPTTQINSKAETDIELTLIGRGSWMLLECRGAEFARTF